MNALTSFRFATSVALVLLAACAGGESVPQPEADAPLAVAEVASEPAGHAMADVATLQGSGPWAMPAQGETRIVLSAASAPLMVGHVTLEITVLSADTDVMARSIDLLSPSMPMHGIVRYPVTEGVAEFEIPMEGQWAIYVNLDELGSNSAEFLFEVQSGEMPGTTHH